MLVALLRSFVYEERTFSCPQNFTFLYFVEAQQQAKQFKEFIPLLWMSIQFFLKAVTVSGQ